MKANRAIAAALAMVVTFFFFKAFSELFFDTTLVALLAAIGAAVLVWHSFGTSRGSRTSDAVHEQHAPGRIDAPTAGASDLASSILTGAFVAGCAGLVIGTVGPILIGAGGQAPLAGIFLMGPTGAILGALGAWIMHRWRGQRRTPAPPR